MVLNCCNKQSSFWFSAYMAYSKSECSEIGSHERLCHGSGPRKCSAANIVHKDLERATMPKSDQKSHYRQAPQLSSPAWSRQDLKRFCLGYTNPDSCIQIAQAAFLTEKKNLEKKKNDQQKQLNLYCRETVSIPIGHQQKQRHDGRRRSYARLVTVFLFASAQIILYMEVQSLNPVF